MTTPHGSIERSRRILLGSLAGSLVILGLAWWGLSGGEPPPAEPDPPKIAAPAEPRPAQSLPSRWDHDGKAGDEPPVVADAAPLQPPPELSPERERWLADPPPAYEPDPKIADAIAAQEKAMADATTALQEVLEGRRGALARSCLKGADSASVFFQANFDARGKLTGHQVADNGTTPDVTACVGKQPFAMSIPAPGFDVRVRGTLSLP